jgi:nucleotide-binding universal stress UspA family protein
MDERYRIVVGVDGSEAGERALRWAMRTAAKHAGSVRAVIIWTPDTAAANRTPEQDERRARARQTLGACVAAALNDNPRVRVSTQISTGEPGQVLVDTAARADLLVLGSRGRGRVTPAGLGAVAEHCVRHAPCPVVVVPEPEPGGAAT